MLAVGLMAGAVSVQAQYASPQGPPPGNYQGGPGGGWDAPPREFRDVQQRGFRDGIEGARRDFENHRPPNVNNRDEFRHPPVGGSLRRDYKDGFRRGYDVGVRHLMGGGGPGGPGPRY
ncbi:hypothetical protein [Granulicella sp. dw_53]|uniref:hypothetical protein n=1 Tax=Granulicella sp. dw_53 TaxID=2719792 RepID=UPI001C4A2C65|nr:hypothetical protein [Granulicella sp. dw_53]